MNRSTVSTTTFVVGWLLGVMAAATAFLPRTATAANTIAIAVPNLSVPESSSSQTGTFDVFVVTSGSSLPEVGDFSVNLQLSPASGVEFTGGAATTADPYIFAGQSPGPGVDILNSGTTIEGTDFASAPPTLVNGDGLLAVTYSVPANTSGTFNLTLVTTGMAATALDDQNANPIPFAVQNATLTVVPSAVYWNGALGTSWNTLSGANFATNWSTTAAGGTDAHALPGANTDVFFTTTGGGSNLNTTLTAPLSIKGLTFTSAATSPVSIGGSALTIGADGLTLQSGAAAATINNSVILSSSQSWTIAGSNPLTINGTLSLTGQTLSKAGSGTLRIDAAPSLGSGSSLAVSAGTLQLDLTSGAASVGSNVTATVATSATLQLAGSVSALSDASVITPSDGNLVSISNSGSTASGGGLQVTGTNQSVGVVSGAGTTSGGVTTYSGDTVVGNGTTGASLTVTQILQDTLTINAGSTLTIRPSGPGSSSVTPAGSGAGSGSASASNAASAAATTPVALALAAPVSDPFSVVQSAINSGNNGTMVVAPTAASMAPIQAAIASVTAAAPSSIAGSVADASIPNTDATSAIMPVAGSGAVSASSLLPFGEATAANLDTTALNGGALVGADDNALLQSQATNGLAFSDSAYGGLATFGTASPTFDNTSGVPEPSSLVLLLLGCAIPLVFLAGRSAGSTKGRPDSRAS